MGNRTVPVSFFYFIEEGGMPKYDIACVGAGISCLAAAALLTKAGKSVCLIDPADRAGGCVAAHEIEGFRFASGPTITYGFEPGGVLRKLFSDLNLSANETSSFAGYQVVMPEHRISVSGEPGETLEELVREFPDEMNGLTRLYRDVHKLSEQSSKSWLSSYVLRQRSSAAYLQSYRFSKSIQAYFEVQARFFFGTSLQDLPLALLVLMLTTAPRSFPGGFTGLADQLISIVLQQKGTWFHGEPFPEMLFHANRITGIRTSRGMIEPRTVLLNVPGQRSETIVFLGIHDEVIPVSMLPNVLCIDDNERLGDYFTLTLSPADVRMAAPTGLISLTCMFHSVNKAFDQPVESFISKITAVVPFLQNFIVTSSMQDPHARQFPLPPSVIVQSSEYRVGRPMLLPCSVKNLKIIPDSVRSLLPAVLTAQAVVEKLK